MAATRSRPLDRDGLRPVFVEPFDGPALALDRWLPFYLPHWSSRERTAARYDLTEQGLRLRIDADTPEWSTEWDPGVRVSNLQTALGSGPVGSSDGPHHFRTGLVVREEQAPLRLFTPSSGVVEVRLAASADPRCLTALWLIGIEDIPERSGELCVVEIFGRDVSPHGTVVGMGIRPFRDPRLVDDFQRLPVDMDARVLHDFAVEWGTGRAVFFIDDEHVLGLDQAPDYPMQLMLDLYELPLGRAGTPRGPFPKTAIVRSVQGFERDVAEP